MRTTYQLLTAIRDVRDNPAELDKLLRGFDADELARTSAAVLPKVGWSRRSDGKWQKGKLVALDLRGAMLAERERGQ